MTSIGVAGSEEETQDETSFAQTQNEENHSMANSVQEETEEPVAQTVRKPRKPFGESIVGRFKGFFENDEAVN